MASKRGMSPYLVYGLLALSLAGTGSYYIHSANYSWLVAWLVSINAVAFVFFAYDKFIAGSGMLRVPELVLNGMALLGGSPLALAAQAMFRHKTAKGSFQFVYWAIVVAQVALLVWYYKYR